MIKKITIACIILFSINAKSQEKYTIKNLSINNKLSNFGTAFYGDNKLVYASPKKKSYIIKNNWKPNQQPFLDLYVGDISGDADLQNVQKFSDFVNTRFHEADVAFSKDNKTVYFSRNNYLNNKYKKDSTGFNLIQLYRAEQATDGSWINIEPMPFNNDHYQTGHPALSADEKTLYFISDMPGGFGKTDIYKASINEDGSIGEPINLGSKVNTSEKEMFPFMSDDNLLYYSSNGFKDGFGNQDVYAIKFSKNETILPVNLGAPINSENDDFAFIINNKTKTGYFSSNRKGGKGDDDIYSFSQLESIKFNCKTNIEGIVVDSETGQSISSSLVTLLRSDGVEIASTKSDESAAFSFVVDCDNKYTVVASKQDYTKDEKEIVTYELEDVELSLSLKAKHKVFVDVRGQLMVNVNPIYFDLDKSFIRPDAAIELGKVLNVMTKYPEIKIALGSHTDSRASANYNLYLSKRRAKSSLEWLIDKGVDPSRITAKGFGETMLVNKCSDGVKCSKQEHQLNRRTEFVIVNPEVIK